MGIRMNSTRSIKNKINKAEKRSNFGIMAIIFIATVVAGSFILNAGLFSETASLMPAQEVFAYSENASVAENVTIMTTNQSSAGVNGSIVTLPPIGQFELDDRRH